ncbi:SH3 domain-binding protein 1-like [Alligator mississippiensis]|uniref:SH3 domain-binding protein 1-like n=1 Tax=Alligator mississippiensis TaxID=8496 RepID=UPI002877E307|nr:SH3 domain-binding protein 1-like [Alligator mississippiensis]
MRRAPRAQPAPRPAPAARPLAAAAATPERLQAWRAPPAGAAPAWRRRFSPPRRAAPHVLHSPRAAPGRDCRRVTTSRRLRKEPVRSNNNRKDILPPCLPPDTSREGILADQHIKELLSTAHKDTLMDPEGQPSIFSSLCAKMKFISYPWGLFTILYHLYLSQNLTKGL